MRRGCCTDCRAIPRSAGSAAAKRGPCAGADALLAGMKVAAATLNLTVRPAVQKCPCIPREPAPNWLPRCFAAEGFTCCDMHTTVTDVAKDWLFKLHR